jgi:hypothetical protein
MARLRLVVDHMVVAGDVVGAKQRACLGFGLGARRLDGGGDRGRR